jgi:hypothetical protein
MNQPHPFQRRRRRESQYYQPVQPFPFMEQQSTDFQYGQNMNASTYQQQYQNPYYQPYQQQYQPQFQNPNQPFYGTGNNSMLSGQYMNSQYPTPYPKPVPNFKQQPTGFQTVISQFKKSDGQLDINKMMDTAGQMMSAVNQMGGLFKGVTSMFK